MFFWPCVLSKRVCVYLSQQHYPLAIRPDDVVHLRTHPLPGQLRSPQARLQNEHNIVRVFVYHHPDLVQDWKT